jgi:endonuclease/exonuclease/phosphatase family metal-dependent hydrolase
VSGSGRSGEPDARLGDSASGVDVGAGVAAESRALRAALAPFPTRADWLASAGGEELAARLDAHLAPVRVRPAASAPHTPPDVAATRAAAGSDTVHVVHWNVLHGIAFDAIARALAHEAALTGADLVSLNEVDVGMTRSGGRDVAFALASALGLHAAWAAQFIELTGGARPPQAPIPDPGPAWFGLALLSRWSLADVRRVVLPSPSDLLFDRERKAGAFVALTARVLHPRRPFTACVVHLDVHGSPQVRAAQMRALLRALDADSTGPVILSGDLNTTTFARGGALRSAATLAALALRPRAQLRRRLVTPQRPPARPREPLFTELAAHGFAYEPFNEACETLDVRFAEVHELDAFPPLLRRPFLRLLRWVEARNAMRLDWIAARGFAAAAPPVTLPHLMRGAHPASDHAPIACRLRDA